VKSFSSASRERCTIAAAAISAIAIPAYIAITVIAGVE
jgi:hypothetical protein